MSSPSRGFARSDRPNLEQKKKLAKELLAAVRKLDSRQAARFTWSMSRFRGQSGQDVIKAGVNLADAQHVIARESGFESWPKLVAYIRELEAEPTGSVARFEDAVRAMIRGDADEFRNLLAKNPELATARSTRHHHGTLAHYLAANGVENEHQITPPNAAEIARILFAHGGAAIIDSPCDIYGGGSGSTPLVALVTSGHPHEAGVQGDLVREFCKAGANPNGLDDDGMPMQCALGFRYPKAAQALAECGARIDNLPTAAALGRMELVKQFLDPGENIVSARCVFPNPGFIEFPESTAPHPHPTMEQALVFACMCGQKEIAELLLNHGVNVNGGPRRGVTALHEACLQGRSDIARFLLKRGADPTLRDEMWNSTAIGWSGEAKNVELVEELFQAGRVEFLDAVEFGKYDIVRRQLEADASLANAPNGQGAALRHAAFKNDLKLARLLLEFGADPSLPNDAGTRARDFSEKGGHAEMIELLASS